MSNTCGNKNSFLVYSVIQTKIIDERMSLLYYLGGRKNKPMDESKFDLKFFFFLKNFIRNLQNKTFSTLKTY